jgi:hypothetical protein
VNWSVLRLLKRREQRALGVPERGAAPENVGDDSDRTPVDAADRLRRVHHLGEPGVVALLVIDVRARRGRLERRPAAERVDDDAADRGGGGFGHGHDQTPSRRGSEAGHVRGARREPRVVGARHRGADSPDLRLGEDASDLGDALLIAVERLREETALDAATGEPGRQKVDPPSLEVSAPSGPASARRGGEIAAVEDPNLAAVDMAHNGRGLLHRAGPSRRRPARLAGFCHCNKVNKEVNKALFAPLPRRRRALRPADARRACATAR